MSTTFSLVVKRLAQLTVLCGVMGCAAAIVSDGDDMAKQRRGAGKSIPLVANKPYQTECTSCHVGYLPGFLPARSWNKLMGDLENHFGENASLDKQVHDEILKYVTANAADHNPSSPRSRKIARLVSSGDAPLRITDTLFWSRKHASVRAYVWKREKVGSKAHCDACHLDAGKGVYDDHDVRVPKG